MITTILPSVGLFKPRGWIRLWWRRHRSLGPGIGWKPASDPMSFSERNGNTRHAVICGGRFSWCPGWKEYDHE